jgi:hypothetical protein
MKSEKFNEKKENEQGNAGEFEKIHEPTWMCENVKMWIFPSFLSPSLLLACSLFAA